jgi:UDP-N-acetylmuramoyl-tripeptide--D-alanyl-D-alanine ligase
MLAAITVGYVNNVTFDHINHALASYVPTNNRSQLTKTEHNSLIVDAYNANPSSMKAAIDNFRLVEADKKMAILGMMGELGAVSEEEHQKIVRMLEAAQFDEVWLVGEEFMKIKTPFRTFDNVEAVKQEIALQKPQGMTILIKGSNSTHLYELPPLL